MRLVTLFDRKGIDFEFLTHPPEGNTVIASELRGHPINEAAKSMLVNVRKDKSSKSKSIGFFLAVVPGDRLIDFKAVARLENGRRTDFANEADFSRLMDCKSGSVPPFSFHSEVQVLVDENITNQTRIIFNAGRLDRSIAIHTQAYLDKFDYKIAPISKIANKTICTESV